MSTMVAIKLLEHRGHSAPWVFSTSQTKADLPPNTSPFNCLPSSWISSPLAPSTHNLPPDLALSIRWWSPCLTPPSHHSILVISSLHSVLIEGFDPKPDLLSSSSNFLFAPDSSSCCFWGRPLNHCLVNVNYFKPYSLWGTHLKTVTFWFISWTAPLFFAPCFWIGIIPLSNPHHPIESDVARNKHLWAQWSQGLSE